MNLTVFPEESPHETNIGLLVKGNAYFVADFPQYLAMQPEALDKTIAHLQEVRRSTYLRFIRHRTVMWFGISCGVLAAAFFADPSSSRWLSIAASIWIVVAVLPSLFAMTRQRRDIFNALTLLRKEIMKAKAARATK